MSKPREHHHHHHTHHHPHPHAPLPLHIESKQAIEDALARRTAIHNPLDNLEPVVSDGRLRTYMQTFALDRRAELLTNGGIGIATKTHYNGLDLTRYGIEHAHSWVPKLLAQPPKFACFREKDGEEYKFLIDRVTIGVYVTNKDQSGINKKREDYEDEQYMDDLSDITDHNGDVWLSLNYKSDRPVSLLYDDEGWQDTSENIPDHERGQSPAQRIVDCLRRRTDHAVRKTLAVMLAWEGDMDNSSARSTLLYESMRRDRKWINVDDWLYDLRTAEGTSCKMWINAIGGWKGFAYRYEGDDTNKYTHLRRCTHFDLDFTSNVPLTSYRQVPIPLEEKKKEKKEVKEESEEEESEEEESEEEESEDEEKSDDSEQPTRKRVRVGAQMKNKIRRDVERQIQALLARPTRVRFRNSATGGGMFSRAKGGDDDEKDQWHPVTRRMLVSLLLAGMAATGGVVPRVMQSLDRPVLLRDLPTRPINISQAVSQFSLNDTEHTGQLLQELYSDLQKLGQGGYGAVYVGRRNHDDTTVAVKQFFGEHDDSAELEFARYAQDCPIDSDECALAPVRRVFTYIEDGEAQGGLEMDYVDGITGWEYEKDRRRYTTTSAAKTTVSELSRTLLPWLKTIHRMHQHNVTHNDIKGDNMIYDAKRDRWTLLDYGLSQHGVRRAYDFVKDLSRIVQTVLGLFGDWDIIENEEVQFPAGTRENVWLRWLRAGDTGHRHVTLGQLIEALDKADADVLLDPEPGHAWHRLLSEQAVRMPSLAELMEEEEGLDEQEEDEI